MGEGPSPPRSPVHKRFKNLVEQWINLVLEHSRLTMQMAESKAD